MERGTLISSMLKAFLEIEILMQEFLPKVQFGIRYYLPEQFERVQGLV